MSWGGGGRLSCGGWTLHLPVPTLVRDSVFRYSSIMFQTVVVGADDSPTAAEAVRQAIELAKLTGGTLHIVSAYSHQQLTSGDGETAKSISSGDLAQALLDDLASRARLAGVEVTAHGKAGSPANAICEVAVEVDADLIVVGNKGMKGARRVLGSVPNSVAHQAPCSVLIAATT
jgi:nucleotide-binding universal stress UspA family protein